MSRQIKNLPASVLQRLRNESRERNQTFQEILIYYGLERFLYRLSKSEYRDRFVLKGALVMMTWPLSVFRTTRDIDFRAFIDHDLEEVARIIKAICNTDVEPDAIRFDVDTVRTEFIIEHAKYPGVHSRLVGYIGTVKIPIQIDIGFSDEISPAPNVVKYPTILDFPPPIVYAYQPETVLSEKVDAIFYYGEINTRMNDFYDIWVISNKYHITGNLLLDSMLTTFKTRGTRIEVDLATLFSEEFTEAKLDLWRAYSSGISKEGFVPTNFQTILARIVEFIQPVLDAIKSDDRFEKRWDPENGWG